MLARNTQKTVFKVSDFLSWHRSGSLILSPAFQRRPVWPRGAKSFLLDTVIRGLPMPIIFLRQKTRPDTLEPEREVVDGQQRLRTLIAYVTPETLLDFDSSRDGFTIASEHNGELAGKRFADLPAAIKQSILDYDFSVQVLPADTEDREVLQIFGRMNSTGVKLNQQELRNAEYFGPFKQTMYRLALEQLSRWRSWRVFSELEIARMLEVEETSDLAITMLKGTHAKSQKDLDKHYREFNGSFPASAELSRRFQAVMDRIDDDLGREMPALEFRRKPLFHTLFSFYYDQMFGLGSALKGGVRAKPKSPSSGAPDAVRLASQRIASSAIPEDLARVLRGATNHLPSRRRRLQFLQGLLASASA